MSLKKLQACSQDRGIILMSRPSTYKDIWSPGFIRYPTVSHCLTKEPQKRNDLIKIFTVTQDATFYLNFNRCTKLYILKLCPRTVCVSGLLFLDTFALSNNYCQVQDMLIENTANSGLAEFQDKCWTANSIIKSLLYHIIAVHVQITEILSSLHCEVCLIVTTSSPRPIRYETEEKDGPRPISPILPWPAAMAELSRRISIFSSLIREV